ncbi:MAG: hypothetical protein RL598_220 [Verrucomicrobiota bacterium]|jgi:hypothetical protein
MVLTPAPAQRYPQINKMIRARRSIPSHGW